MRRCDREALPSKTSGGLCAPEPIAAPASRKSARSSKLPGQILFALNSWSRRNRRAPRRGAAMPEKDRHNGLCEARECCDSDAQRRRSKLALAPRDLLIRGTLSGAILGVATTLASPAPSPPASPSSAPQSFPSVSWRSFCSGSNWRPEASLSRPCHGLKEGQAPAGAEELGLGPIGQSPREPRLRAACHYRPHPICGRARRRASQQKMSPPPKPKTIGYAAIGHRRLRHLFRQGDALQLDGLSRRHSRHDVDLRGRQGDHRLAADLRVSSPRASNIWSSIFSSSRRA